MVQTAPDGSLCTFCLSLSGVERADTPKKELRVAHIVRVRSRASLSCSHLIPLHALVAVARRHARANTTAQTKYREHGLNWFTRGLGTTLVRAVPVNAVTFFVYDHSLRLLNQATPTG